MCRKSVWIYDLASDHSKELEMLWAQWLCGVFFNKRKREMPHTLLLEYSKIHNTYSNMKGYEKSYSKSSCLSLSQHFPDNFDFFQPL